MERKIVTRREFLRWSTLATGAAVLAACAPKATPQPTTAPTPAAAGETHTAAVPTVAATPAPQQVIQIRYAGWDWAGCADGTKDQDWCNKVFFPKFIEKNPDIKPVWEPYGDGWETKTLTMMAAGTAPDVLCAWSPIMETWTEKNQILDIQPLIDRDMPDEPKKYIPAIWEQMWHPFKKIRMGIPGNVDVTSVYYNKTAFQEAGVPLPTKWTVDEYTEIACKLIKKDASGKITRWGGDFRYSTDWWNGYFFYVEAFGGKVRDDETRLKCLLDGEAAQQALEWIRKNVWDTNCFVQGNQLSASGLPDTSNGGALTAGILVMMERSCQPALFAKNSEGFELDVAPVPAGPKDSACMGIPGVWMLYQGTQKRGTMEAAWKLLSYMGSEEFDEMLTGCSSFIPLHLNLVDKWPAAVRANEPKLEKMNLEAIVEQIRSGQARAPEMFRFQNEAQEIIDPAMQAIFVTGREPVSSLKGIIEKVNTAEQEALARAGA